MKATAHDRYTIERAYRDVFGLSEPSTSSFPEDAVYPLCLNALMRSSPVTEDELQDWIAKNTPSAQR
ncbi:MAG: hypothetical protein EOM37_10415 [Proteobacteria bacterium]|nr:hypothetical protein [Pseudomonadota bacterium]